MNGKNNLKFSTEFYNDVAIFVFQLNAVTNVIK